jgi:putative oxidoreductase
MTASLPYPNNRRVDLGLAILRIIVGVIFVAHGYQKLFTFGLAGVTTGFTQMGVPAAGIVGPLVGCLEFVGGILLIPGIATRWIAILLALDMLGAMSIVHYVNGFFLPNGIEFALSLCGACIALALTGAGAYSVDNSLAMRRRA